MLFAFPSSILQPALMNLFFYSWREACKSCLYLAGARFAEECENGKWKNIAAYWTLLGGDNTRGRMSAALRRDSLAET